MQSEAFDLDVLNYSRSRCRDLFVMGSLAQIDRSLHSGSVEKCLTLSNEIINSARSQTQCDALTRVSDVLTSMRDVLTSMSLLDGCLLNVPATWECMSGTDLLRQFDVPPHWDRSCRSNFPSHPVTVY